jgi:hypothetical protein
MNVTRPVRPRRRIALDADVQIGEQSRYNPRGGCAAIGAPCSWCFLGGRVALLMSGHLWRPTSAAALRVPGAVAHDRHCHGEALSRASRDRNFGHGGDYAGLHWPAQDGKLQPIVSQRRHDAIHECHRSGLRSAAGQLVDVVLRFYEAVDVDATSMGGTRQRSPERHAEGNLSRQYVARASAYDRST